METLSGLHRHCGRRKPRTSKEEGGRSFAVRGAHHEHREVDRRRVTEQLSIPVAEESWSGGLGRRHVRVVLVIGSLAFDELAPSRRLLRLGRGPRGGGVDGAPAVLGGLDQLERHRGAGDLRARSLGDLGPVPDGGKVDSR